MCVHPPFILFAEQVELPIRAQEPANWHFSPGTAAASIIGAVCLTLLILFRK